MAQRHGLQPLYLCEGAVAEYASLRLRSRRVPIFSTDLRIALSLFTDSSGTPRIRGQVSCPKRHQTNRYPSIGSYCDWSFGRGYAPIDLEDLEGKTTTTNAWTRQTSRDSR